MSGANSRRQSTKRPIMPRTIRYSDLNTANLHVSEYKDTTYNTSQKYAYVNYSNSPLQIQSPDIKLTHYGIPRYNPKHHKTQRERMFIKIPENVNDEKCAQFFQKLEEIDEWFDSEDYKDSMFGKHAKLYKYIPIVRTPQVEEDEDEDSNKGAPKAKPRYIKLKIDSDYETNNVLTKCFVKEGSERIPCVDIVTVDDLLKYVRFQSTIKFLVLLNRTYMSKNKLGNSSFRNYGVILKLVQVICDPVVVKTPCASDECLIIESDED